MAIGADATVDLGIKTHGSDDLDHIVSSWTDFNQALEVGTKLIGFLTGVVSKATTAVMGLINTGSQFENYTVKWETLLGSVEAAEERMKSLFSFAASTPFELPGVVEAATTLEAFGVFSERAMVAAGDMAAAFDIGFNDAAQAIALATTGEMERLKQFGITSATIAAQLGHDINRSTVAGMKEIGDAVVEIFEIKAGGGMARAAKTYTGMMSMFSDKWTEFKLMVSDAGFFDTVREVFGTILKSVDDLFASGKVETAAQSIGQVLSNLFEKATIAMLQTADGVLAMAQDIEMIFGPMVDFFGQAKSSQEKVDKFWDDLAKNYPAIFGAAAVLTGGNLEIERQLRAWERQQATAAGGGILGAGRETIQALIAEFKTQFADPGEAMPISRLAAAINTLADNTFGGRGRGEPSVGGGTKGPFGADRYLPIYGPTIEQLMGPDFGPEAPDPYELAADRLDAWQDKVDTVTSTLTGYWENYYSRIEQVGQAWVKGEGKLLSGILKASYATSRAILGDWIKMKVKKAAMGKLEAIAEMFTAEGTFNFWSAAKFAASAAAWGLLGGVASGALGGNEPTPIPVEITNMGADSPGGASGITSFSKTATVRAEYLSIVVNIIHNSAVVYGREGLREMIIDEMIPTIEEAVALGSARLAA